MRTNHCALTALLGGAALVVLSCGERSPLPVQAHAPVPEGLVIGPPVPFPPPSQFTRLLRCAPLAFESVTQTIGPEGGTLRVGAYMLSVPLGALDAPVSITAVAPSDTVNRVTFQPEGLTFLRPPALTMSYANCGLVGEDLLVPKRIALTTPALEILQLLPSLDIPSAQEVTGLLGHFSDYAIAW